MSDEVAGEGGKWKGRLETRERKGENNVEDTGKR